MILRGTSTLADQSWSQIKGKNFLIYYEVKADETVAQKVLREADRYYERIGENIGYSRTNKFWTWDERVKIFLFKDRISFLKSTGQPAWSTGYADRDSQTFQSKTIITFKQEEQFIDGLLPHEISHLILHDFVGNAQAIPIWFDEGVAQYQENGKKEIARRILKKLISHQQSLPFEQFWTLDVRRVKDTAVAEVFYAQSLSCIDFLVSQYGTTAFSRLCRALRDGKTIEKGLLEATSGNLRDRKDFEMKWMQFINR